MFMRKYYFFLPAKKTQYPDAGIVPC